MSESLLDAIKAVDALNSWVRSESFQKNWLFGGNLKRSVYWLKRQALKAAGDAGIVWHRGVKVDTKCHHCNGNGIYIDDCGTDRGECYKCTRGTATLKFLESRIDPPGITWHTPENHSRGSFSTSVCYYVGACTSTDWKPNTPGKSLRIDQVVDALNIAEDFFLERDGGYYDDDCGGPFFDFNYSLNLGQVTELCPYCGSGDIAVRRHTGKDFLDWCAPLCKTHEQSVDEQRFKADTFPSHLITGAIRKWHDRHRVFYNAVVAPKRFGDERKSIKPL